MRIQRSYLVRVMQTFEGEPPDDWDLEAIAEDGLDWEHDQYACDNWTKIEDTYQLLDNDDLDYGIVQ